MGDLKKRYKVKKENIHKLKVFLKKIKDGKQHKLGGNLLQ
jgi:hypothetical protein